MPNWCFSYAEIKIKNNAERNSFFKTLAAAIESKPRVESDFGSAWLGNILDSFGIDVDSVSCRGSITSANMCGDTVQIQAETAWTETPLVETLSTIIDKMCYDAELLWYCEEPGCQLYATNDPTFDVCDGRFKLLFNYNDTYVFEGFSSLNVALACASKLAKRKIASLNELYDFAYEAYEDDEDSDICIYEYDLVRD